MSKPRYLTKSRFKLGRECGTKLYYTGKKDQYEDQSLEDSFLKALASGGFQVGELAKIYHPGGHMIETLDYEEAIAQTDELLKKDTVTIYEPAIRFGSLFVRVDVLVKTGDKVKLIEVKSKSFDPNEEDPFYDKRALKKNQKKLKSKWMPYLEDIAFQTYVARQARPDLTITPYLMLSDKSKVTSVDGLNQNFLLVENDKGRTGVKVREGTSIDSVGDQILCRIFVGDEVDLIHEGEKGRSYAQIVDELTNAYINDQKIQPKLDTHCKGCQFKSEDIKKSGFHHCWKEAAGLSGTDLLGPFVFDVWNFRKAKSLLQNGVYLMQDICEEDVNVKESEKLGMSSSERQWLQIEANAQKKQDPYIEKGGLAEEISSWKFPLHFIDFETTMVALPFNKGRRPYEQIAFQFSHHLMKEDGSIEHNGQYINREVGFFPNFDFLRALKAQLENDGGTIFRYAAHENTVLCQIYDQLETSGESDKTELQKWIRTITDSKNQGRGVWNGERSMVDMCELVKRYYFHPMTNGSNSIKKVLPATLYQSQIVKDQYSMPTYGSKSGIKSLNYKDWTWVHYDESGGIKDPYKLLPPIFDGIDTEKLDLMIGSDELADGGSAMMAYAKMQFTEMSEIERKALTDALLKYCELDTFAMVILFEHWVEIAELPIGHAA